MVASTAADGVVLELARLGNCGAIANWLNRHLHLDGLSASVDRATSGCLQVSVELPALPGDPQWQRRLVRAICHPIWRLNSETVQGVRIVARLAGRSEVIWNQSVRIVTPANRRSRHRSPRRQTRSRRDRQPWRLLLMAGSAAAAFVLGCWLSLRPPAVPVAATVAPVSPAIARTSVRHVRPLDRIATAPDSVPVVPHPGSSGDRAVTLAFGGELSDEFPGAFPPERSRQSVLPPQLRDADVAAASLDVAENAEAIAWLDASGIDLVDLASERLIAAGDADLDRTFDRLERADLHHLGSGRDLRHARRPKLLEVKGQRIAYFSYALSEYYAATDDLSGVNFADRDRMAEDLNAVRDRVDWIVVSLDWGGDLSSYPEPWQQDLARSAIDFGADVVLGNHPRVVQGGELYRDRPIAYQDSSPYSSPS